MHENRRPLWRPAAHNRLSSVVHVAALSRLASVLSASAVETAAGRQFIYGGRRPSTPRAPIGSASDTAARTSRGRVTRMDTAGRSHGSGHDIAAPIRAHRCTHRYDRKRAVQFRVWFPPSRYWNSRATNFPPSAQVALLPNSSTRWDRGQAHGFAGSTLLSLSRITISCRRKGSPLCGQDLQVRPISASRGSCRGTRAFVDPGSPSYRSSAATAEPASS